MTYNIEEATLPAPLGSTAAPKQRGAQLDTEHVGDIRGGFGTIRQHDTGPRSGWWPRIKGLTAPVILLGAASRRRSGSASCHSERACERA